ncbi:ABC transporter substrate-binding protein [Actinotignum sp. GS-2025b]|uniref:ABC transporter substrate-binding protein n=1 Tax=Actinotignum sp. GS-2025b TaxID=3427275 RepID=UPI003F45CAAD
MRTAKKALAFTTSILLAATFSGCTSGDSATEAPKPDKIEKIGLMVQDMSNPFFSAMDKGAKEAAEKIGATLNIQDAKLDLANQNTQIDTFIQQGVDLIVVSAVDESGLQPAIERARQAGIFVVAVDTPAKGADAIVMTDAVQAGEIACTYLFEQMGGKGNILVVDGTPIQTITDRIKGCNQAMKNFPGIKEVGHQNSQNDRATGLSVTTDMLTAASDVQGIFGMNDPSALGATLAVQQAGRTNEIKVVGIDASPEGLQELRTAGSPFVGTATQEPAKMVEKAIEVGQQLARGESLTETTILIPSQIITRDAVDEYPGW